MVCWFCSSATTQRVARQILAAIPKGMRMANIAPPPLTTIALSKSEGVMIYLLEETLRTYLSHAPPTKRSGLEKLQGTVSVPNLVHSIGQAGTMVHTKLQGAPLLFLLLLHQHQVALESRRASDSEWFNFILNIFEVCNPIFCLSDTDKF